MEIRKRVEFGQRVVALRKTAGFSSTTALAKKLRISQPSMRAIEKGITDPDKIEAATFLTLVNLLLTNPYYLMEGVGPMGPLIAPGTDEGEAASMARQLRPEYREAWMAAGHALRRSQPPTQPSTDQPFIAPVPEEQSA